MANKKISERYVSNPITDTIADGDLFVTTDISDTTDDSGGTDKVGTFSAIKTYIESFTSYFNVSSDTLDDITAGSTNKHFTATDETKLDAVPTITVSATQPSSPSTDDLWVDTN